MRVSFKLLGWRVNASFSVYRQPYISADEIAALMRDGAYIVCWSRCLYCGRQTPHEVCHAHSERTSPGWSGDDGEFDVDALWGTGRDQEPETCFDPDCPAWEPEEAERLREKRRIAEVVG